MYYENYLYHHGVKGQKWGVRRYVNPDGTYTEAGKRRLAQYQDKVYQRDNKFFDKQERKYIKKMGKADIKGNERKFQDHLDTYSGLRARRLLNNEAIRNMTISDMNKEKKHAAAINVANVLVNVGGVALASTLKAPRAIIGYRSARKYNTNDRINTKIAKDTDDYYSKRYNARMDLLEKARPGQTHPVVNPYRTIGPVEEKATWKAIGNRIIANDAYSSGNRKKKK